MVHGAYWDVCVFLCLCLLYFHSTLGLSPIDSHSLGVLPVVRLFHYVVAMLAFSFLFLCVQARGIDVQQVSLVINYDLPANRENYIHRYVMC